MIDWEAREERERRKRREDFLTGLVAVVVCMAIIVGLVVGVRTWARHYAGRQCDRWAEQSGYETRMADFTWVDFHCVARTSDGRWLPIGQLRDVAP